MAALILSLFLLTGNVEAAPPPWVVLVYECDRPAGILLTLDPPRWFPASGDLTPYVAGLINASVEAGRSATLVVGQNCAPKEKT